MRSTIIEDGVDQPQSGGIPIAPGVSPGSTTLNKAQPALAGDRDQLAVGLRTALSKIPRNLRADPFSHRDGDAIPDHSVRVVVTSRESESVRNSLQPGVFSKCKAARHAETTCPQPASCSSLWRSAQRRWVQCRRVLDR